MENASKALIIAGAILIAILLIGIGMILINSGSGVTESGASSMNSQKIQTFNSQFTPYEGMKKGSEIRSLYNVVNASNATDEKHHVVITYGAGASTGDGTFSGADLKANTSYNVQLIYCPASGADEYITEPGYVYQINIQY